MVDFFYPHTCTIYRGEWQDPETGVIRPKPIYCDIKCYLQQGNTSMRSDMLLGEDTVHLAKLCLEVLPEDNIEIVLENGLVHKARIKQVYPIKDKDFGGQELKLYQRDVL